MSKCRFRNICPCDPQYYESHCEGLKGDSKPDGLCAAYIMAEYIKIEEDAIKLKGKMFDDAFSRWTQEAKGDESNTD